MPPVLHSFTRILLVHLRGQYSTQLAPRRSIHSSPHPSFHAAQPARAQISEGDPVVDVLQKIQDTPEVAESVMRFSEIIRDHGFEMNTLPSKLVLFQMLSKPAIKEAAFQMVAVFEKNGIQFDQEIAMKLASSLPALKEASSQANEQGGLSPRQSGSKGNKAEE